MAWARPKSDPDITLVDEAPAEPFVRRNPGSAGASPCLALCHKFEAGVKYPFQPRNYLDASRTLTWRPYRERRRKNVAFAGQEFVSK
jgi:hypothetical protein